MMARKSKMQHRRDFIAMFRQYGTHRQSIRLEAELLIKLLSSMINTLDMTEAAFQDYLFDSYLEQPDMTRWYTDKYGEPYPDFATLDDMLKTRTFYDMINLDHVTRAVIESFEYDPDFEQE